MFKGTEFIESLKRLYAKGNVTKEDLKTMVINNTITPEEYEEITGEKYKAA
ncbi:MAG: XkdX family protein [Chryseobacterium sp.]|uniref:XkdX family protein n=1 Tax=Chryseobacterium sp. TaxID=1871047 RepID=UPI002FC81AE7